MNSEMKNLILKSLLIVFVVVMFAALPVFYLQSADFAGADSKAEKVIKEVNPDYEPWLVSIWEPPSGEVESLLFVVQGALGAGIIGYCLGYLRGRKKRG